MKNILRESPGNYEYMYKMSLCKVKSGVRMWKTSVPGFVNIWENREKALGQQAKSMLKTLLIMFITWRREKLSKILCERIEQMNSAWKTINLCKIFENQR